DLEDTLRVLACAKHYVGDGGTAYGSGSVAKESDPSQHYPMDQGDTRLSEADLRRIRMAGYVTAIQAGVGSIMPSYSSWNGARMSRIDDAVLRILRVKYAMGLFEAGRSQMADRALQRRFGSAEHRAVARRAVRQSLVLLKNDKRTLPLAKTARRIHVVGKNAD